MNKKVLLMILDGWGLGNHSISDAIFNANTPFIDSLYQKYPWTTLDACGEAVGLPEGQMGNSEVGHLNIGAGRIVYQDFVRINKAFEAHEIENNPVLKDAILFSKEKNKKIHLLGLVSDGGVHSHINHLYGLLDVLNKSNCNNVFVHAFTDGRDTDPNSGLRFIKNLDEKCKTSNAKLATVTGRYFAMDRDKRWERIKIAYDALVNGVGNKQSDIEMAIKDSYEAGITDEFLKPIILNDGNVPRTTIENGDVVIFFNFRTDRGRQLTTALSQKDFREFNMHKLDLDFITLTVYDDTYTNVKTLFTHQNLSYTLGEVLELNKKSQVRAAETEKYPHVTFFFSGGKETPFEGEKRILVNSPKVATYDMQPEMSAVELKNKVIEELKAHFPDFICINFANPDMVGHTGVYNAIIKAVETVDLCAKELTEIAVANGYQVLITADHGNADFVVNKDGSPNTAHSLNKVPFVIVSDSTEKYILKSGGKLGNIAPTILKIMQIDKPQLMNEEALF